MDITPAKSKPPLVFACLAIAIITACLFSVGVIVSWLLVGGVIQRLGLCLITYPLLVAWQQYVSMFRCSRRAAAVTAILGGIIGIHTTMLLLTTLRWQIEVAQNNPSHADWTGFIVFAAIAVTGMSCFVCNWIWYKMLRNAEEQGNTTTPSEKFTFGELMWLVVAISLVLAVSSFWYRTFSDSYR